MLGLATLSASRAKPSRGLLLGHCTLSAANHSARGCSSGGSSPSTPTPRVALACHGGAGATAEELAWHWNKGSPVRDPHSHPVSSHGRWSGVGKAGWEWSRRGGYCCLCMLSIPPVLLLLLTGCAPQPRHSLCVTKPPCPPAQKLLFHGSAWPPLSNAAGPASIPP